MKKKYILFGRGVFLKDVTANLKFLSRVLQREYGNFSPQSVSVNKILNRYIEEGNTYNLTKKEQSLLRLFIHWAPLEREIILDRARKKQYENHD